MQESINLDNWTDDIESSLDKLVILCLLRSKYHKNNYLKMSNLLKYFKIPIIILSGLNSVFNVTLSNFTSQLRMTITCSFISLIVGLIGSIELFLQIQKNMEVNLLNSKEFYLLAIEIRKILNLDKNNRHVNPSIYYNDIFSKYSKLVENSVIDKYTHDTLISINFISNLNEDEKIKLINTFSIESIINVRQEMENKKNGNHKKRKNSITRILNSLKFSLRNNSNDINDFDNNNDNNIINYNNNSPKNILNITPNNSPYNNPKNSLYNNFDNIPNYTNNSSNNSFDNTNTPNTNTPNNSLYSPNNAKTNDYTNFFNSV